MGHCPTREQLQQLLAEQLSEALREAIETHVEACGACQETLARLNEEGGQIDPRLLGGSPAVPLPASEADFVRHLGENPSGPADPASAPTDRPGPAPIAFPGPPTDKGPLGQLDRFAIRKELASISTETYSTNEMPPSSRPQLRFSRHQLQIEL